MNSAAYKYQSSSLDVVSAISYRIGKWCLNISRVLLRDPETLISGALTPRQIWAGIFIPIKIASICPEGHIFNSLLNNNGRCPGCNSTVYSHLNKSPLFKEE